MSTEEHLKMFECLVDTGADVLRNLSEIRLLDNQKKSFNQFLEDERHYFYHQYQQKTLCCECSPHGCTIIGTGKMESHIFNKVYYFDAKRRRKGHFVKNGMHDTQKCIHAFNPRNIKMDDLDLSDLNYFLWTKGALSSQETRALQIIMDTRSRVCHPSSTTSIELPEINNMWATLENAILDLSQPERYKNMTKRYIESLRERKKIETEKILYEVNQIKKTVEQELTKTRTELTGQFIGCMKNLFVYAQAPPQVPDDNQASGGNDQINMITTLEIPSVSNENQRKLAESLPTAINSGSEVMYIDETHEGSIVLDLRVSHSIFRDTETLRSALMALIQEVVDKGKIDTNVQDAIYITLTFNSRLSSHETEVLKALLTQEMSYILYEREPEGLKHVDSIDNSELLEPATKVRKIYNEESNESDNSDNEHKEKDKCFACFEKDERIKQLQDKINELEKFMPGQDDTRIQEWINRVQCNVPSDSGIGPSDLTVSGLIETASDTSVEMIQPENYFKETLGSIDKHHFRWITIGICLQTILVPVLRTYAAPKIIKLYYSLIRSNRIDTENSRRFDQLLRQTGVFLDFGNINNNRRLYGGHSAKYDYRVRNAVELSKIYAHWSISNYSGFDESWTCSALLSNINKMNIFTPIVRHLSCGVRTERNFWAHCDIKRYNSAQFCLSIKVMEHMVLSLGLSVAKERNIIHTLNKWKTIAISEQFHDTFV